MCLLCIRSSQPTGPWNFKVVVQSVMTNFFASERFETAVGFENVPYCLNLVHTHVEIPFEFPSTSPFQFPQILSTSDRPFLPSPQLRYPLLTCISYMYSTWLISTLQLRQCSRHRTGKKQPFIRLESKEILLAISARKINREH